ncbi:type II toxin-antitoxin system HigB family toxin [Paraburkholderia flagellata]|uniref:type II toxin-antitoxin system HigB family toxin n=1 Tax=Paraburkholderia flagellata TaxID=2883241 RepID=UPI0027E48BBF|nr:type II toxin-antitoxin system HigB family toxin [Paraburkholderia flagellata]
MQCKRSRFAMKVHGLDRLDGFASKHPPARVWIGAWLADARDAQWSCSHDIKLRYPTASFLAGNRVIFNVKGNDYRMVSNVAYRMGIVVVTWVGTHAEYSKINWEVRQNEASSR